MKSVFGKHFASMYLGSMVGAGAMRFAVWGYVIANMVPDDKTEAMQVELNPRLLGLIFGEPMKDVEDAIEWLCSPDPESRSKEEGGRRLIRLGQYDYRVVNGMKYRAIKDQESRREQNRQAQERWRDRQKAREIAAMQRKSPKLPKNPPEEREMERERDAVA